MTAFTKAHAYGNDFLYVRQDDLPSDTAPEKLAVEMCDRHTGIGADGLVVYRGNSREASMRLWNADGGRAEVSGNGVRALAAVLLRNDEGQTAAIAIQTEGGLKTLERVDRANGRQTFRADMGTPVGLREVSIPVEGESVNAVVLNIGNPQCVILGPLPAAARFGRLGPALERHAMFPEGTNVEFAHVQSTSLVEILIWERGCGPTFSSGTGSCASLVAAAAFGGAARAAEVVAPGGRQWVEWRSDGHVHLTGWAELLCDGNWLRQIPRTS